MMFNRIKGLISLIYDFFTSDKNASLVKWIDRFITFFLLGLLVYQLYGLPLSTIVSSLPISPFFYLIWLFLFFLVPVSEYFIYKYKWTYSGLEVLKGFVLKKIYNNELYNYTGEIYFVSWISSYLKIGKSEAALFIKDNNVVSSFVSSILAFSIIGILWGTGHFDASILWSNSNSLLNFAAVFVLILIAYLTYTFKGVLFHSDKKLTLKLFLGYSYRFVFRHIVLVFMWYFAAPFVPVDVWLNFLFIKILLDRLPVGNRSLIFLSMAPYLSSSFEIGIETFTGIQLAVTILDKAMSALALIWAKKQVDQSKVNE